MHNFFVEAAPVAQRKQAVQHRGPGPNPPTPPSPPPPPPPVRLPSGLFGSWCHPPPTTFHRTLPEQADLSTSSGVGGLSRRLLNLGPPEPSSEPKGRQARGALGVRVPEGRPWPGFRGALGFRV